MSIDNFIGGLPNTVLDGKTIIECPHMTKMVHTSRRRPWKERLFSWPWTPFRAIESKVEHVPSEDIIVMGSMLIMNPKVAKTLRDAIEREEKLR